VLTSIVLNLVANARDAIEGKGSIVINTALSDQHKETERTLTISIKDDGQGIKEEHLEKVFEPFFSTKSSHKGLGLGLSTVVRQLDAMAGELEVDSKIGEGTTMTIRLPVSIEPDTDAAHVHRGV
jgi:signal transduction histidine kinase